MERVEINGITLAYQEFGEGDNYLISTQNFFLAGCHMERLGKPPYNYHVFLLTMRGYGESEHIFDSRPRDYTKIWGEDVLAFARAKGIERFYYTGVSHGNWAGWYIAFHAPQFLRGFACCDGIAQFREPAGSEAAPTPEPVDGKALAGNREALAKMAWMEHWPTENPERLARRAANHEEHLEILMGRKPEEFAVRNNNMSACDARTEEEFYQALSRIPVPVMILNGMLDPLARMEDALRVAKAIPGAVLHAYQHLGHGGPDECPELVARDCDRFFRDSEGRIL